MQVSSIKDLKNFINRSVTWAFVVILFLSIMFLTVMHMNFKRQNKEFAYERLHYASELLASGLSEKLNMIASSEVFLDYLRSGWRTREIMLSDFLFRLSSIEGSPIVGMELTNKNGLFIQDYGIHTHNYITISLCYLGNSLDSNAGYCQYDWKLFFDQALLAKAIAQFSPDIIICEECDSISFALDNNFGSFPIADNSDIKINLLFSDFDNFFIVWIVVLFLVLASFFVWNKYRIKSIIAAYIGEPLEDLVDKIKQDKPLNKDNYQLDEMRYLVKVLKNWKVQSKKLYEQNKVLELYNLSAQVAHDIKSPLTALEVVTKDLKSVPEEERIIIRDAVDRIYGIANNLLNKYREKDKAKTNKTDNELVYFLLKNIICEKQTEFSSKPVIIIFESNDSTYDLSVGINKIEFKRIISNLINNAIEAIEHADSKVIVTLTSKLGEAIITVTDNGSGISEQDLSQVMQGGFSKGKEHGSGLGIAHAIKHIKAWGGDYDIASELGKGTTFTIRLPISESVSWFAKRLDLFNIKTLVIADDDKSIHQVWRKRLGELVDATDTEIIDFYTLDELNNYMQQTTLDNILFLIDYEFIGDKSNGLEFINQHNLAKHAYLVTSRYEDESVRKRCQELGITLIPKSYAAYIPISVTSPEIDLILIDDNKSLTKSWELSAKIADKKIKTFNSIDALLQFVTPSIKDVPIYIDYNLNDQLTGIELAKQLHGQGFKQLYLATGYDKSHFTEPMPWIVDIVGKKPPF